ncbi:hypothetical protein [Serratia sp. BIGb0163]|uniref:hypothetical protein n=1 Tax=Serratia sp. BIGb0163 TaxID=2940613 RepID=UPI00216895B4|nr:hypothetical protein [Serratia sp. BIGb0163]MCS4264993.1 hypothetical protein [Serratia sp. BIGb0163]
MDNKFRKLAREIVEELVDCGCADPEPVQQYLTWTERKLRSALLAELEEKEKRIAELEAIATDYAGKFQKAQDAAKHLIIMNDSAQVEIAHLKVMLATPVRLPDAYQTSCSESEKYLCPVEVAEAIRAAGFKCVGDE